MDAHTRHEPMLRKPILMPPSMIKKVDGIAKLKKVSFAEVVREAVNSYGGSVEPNDEQILETLADILIKTTRNLLKKMDEIEGRLNETHSLLEEAQDGGQ